LHRLGLPRDTGRACLSAGRDRRHRDVSSAALAVASKNINKYRLQERTRLIRSDLFASLEGERYDLIVANPPYVSAAAMRKLPAEYLHEPGLALGGGRDGLALVRRIIEKAGRHLQPRGLLVCEIGDGRRALERAYPRLAFSWPQPSAFMLRREEMG